MQIIKAVCSNAANKRWRKPIPEEVEISAQHNLKEMLIKKIQFLDGKNNKFGTLS